MTLDEISFERLFKPINAKDFKQNGISGPMYTQKL